MKKLLSLACATLLTMPAISQADTLTGTPLTVTSLNSLRMGSGSVPSTIPARKIR